MLLIRLLRFLRGTVTFLITGAFPEKLLNRCARERIPVWDASPTRGGCKASAYARSYRRISRLARRDQNKTRLLTKKGMPFFCRRMRRRWGLPIGAAAAGILLWYLTGHIWIITVSGCQSIPQEKIYDMLSECGVTVGVTAKSIDPKRVERNLLLMDDRLSWTAVNLNGSIAEIVVSECIEPPQIMDPSDRYANVVAAQDGQIRVLEPYTGQALLHVGDTVSAGDVIVSGVTDDQYGNTRLKYARAKVIADVYEKSTVCVPFSETVIQESMTPVTGRELWVFGKRLLPAQEENFAQDPIRVETKTTGILFPFLLVRENSFFLPEETAVNRNAFEAKEEAMRRLRAWQEENGVIQILQEEFTVEQTEDMLILHAVVYAQKDIARIVEFSAAQATNR